MSLIDRRNFLQRLAAATGAVVLVPSVSACGGSQASSEPTSQAASSMTPAVPETEPADWEPISFNRERGNAGAIPDSYLPSINGEDGETAHLGKHLPYVPDTDGLEVPAGYIAIMWGDPDKGHTRHPNAPRNESNNNEGHWYNWIRIRKADDPSSQELESSYSEWPGIDPSDNGAYAVYGGGDITEDSGKNTVYLAALPEGVSSGDRIRVYAHCLTHGEYVDFITVA